MNRLIPFIIILTLFRSISAFAQESSEPQEDERYKNWYQIELIVFERKNETRAEIWPSNIRLEYPRELEFLFSEEEWLSYQQALQDDYSAEAENNLNDGEEKQTPDEEALDSNEQSAEIVEDNATFNPISTESPNDIAVDRSAFVDAAPEIEATSEIQAMETPRIYLSEDQLQLRQEAQRLRNRSAYNVLFHNAWREMLEPTDQSKAIPISGGEQFDQNNELEGWIRISLDRFLHLNTKLWKVDYELNYGQETDYWPQIPPPPSPLATNLQQETPSNDIDFGFSQYFNVGQKSIDVDTQTLKSELALNSYDAIEKRPYVVNRIITLNQKRRMRSEELHYIDHPKLGILVLVTPYVVYLPEEDQNNDNLEGTAPATETALVE